MADHASGSLSASQYASKPLRNASAKTAASGKTKNKNKKTSEIPIKV
jgi:hypothetical protein